MGEIAAHSGLGPFDPYWADDAPRPGRDRRGWGRRIALGLAAGAGLVGVTALAPGPSSAPSPASASAPAPASSETVDPALAPLFTFETADGARARYEARIDRARGARRDAYSLGALEGDGPALRVEIWKSASARAPGSLFVEIAEETARFGAAVERLGVSQIATSSQGPVEWADLTLAGARGKRDCVGFRFLGRADGGLHGVACAAAGAKIDAGVLSCLADRLALTRAGREAGLADIVKSAGIRRPSCRAAIG
ncbi:MAG TPA: hypothetical protein VEF36_02650 [Roseiarcus sp.]|nr:hypothetical protein [Roseiarcus sp.]